MGERRVGLSAPWVEHLHKVEAACMLDEDVTVDYDDDSKTVTLRVRGTDKAAAYEAKIRHELDFGGVRLHVNVVPDNSERTEEDLIQDLFSGNDILVGTATEEAVGGTVTYAIVQPTVLQFWDDNMGSIYGIRTMTAEDCVRDVFDLDAFVCSDLVED